MERDRNIDEKHWSASFWMLSTGDGAENLDMWPWPGIQPWPLGGTILNPLSNTGQAYILNVEGKRFFFFTRKL